MAYHHLRDLAESGKLAVLYMPNHDNPADLYTKPLPGPQLETLRNTEDVDQGTDCILCQWVVNAQYLLPPSQCSLIQLERFGILSLVVEYQCHIVHRPESVRVIA